MKILKIFLIIICSKTIAQETKFSKIPKNINKQIQKNYQRNNVFYFYFPEYKDSLLLWKYENGKVIWKFLDGNKIKESGEFISEINSNTLSINATNKILRNEIEKLNTDYNCTDVLDGAFLGYVYSIDNEEMIGQNYIAASECAKSTNSTITKDFKIIFDNIWKTK
ncbi:hypothetical protein OMO38_18095 [Chryseobacterium sp. 09-1422]|uniref:Uncharacterized protein n=1 Tax=Chryseobacterium kimseyorum TaxID=2984028 RepID=A0ABT3I358_9FLAO|nr:hypothetical protein [Chryseobacterium kimseyorum]MCW3170443.1 hypothetical protein [Chryseobacterium kimseyorum]